MKRAYRNALSMIVQGSIICQAIDKKRELDRYLARQQKHKTPVNEAQIVSDGITTATALNADIGFHIEVEANHV